MNFEVNSAPQARRRMRFYYPYYKLENSRLEGRLKTSYEDIVEIVNLRGNQITDSGVTKLVMFLLQEHQKFCSSFDISSNPNVTSLQYVGELLKGLPTLKHLFVEDLTNVSREKFHEFASALSSTTTLARNVLETLSLQNNKSAGGEVILYVLLSLVDFKKLKTINVCNCGINAAAIENTGSQLKLMVKLSVSRLILSKNECGSDIAKLLPNQLVALEAEDVKLTSDASTEFFASLSKNLEELNIADNELSTSALAKYLGEATKLHTLSLRRCNFGDHGPGSPAFVELMETLGCAEQLRVVDFSDIPISPVFKDFVRRFLARSARLEELRLERCDLSREDASDLVCAILENEQQNKSSLARIYFGKNFTGPGDSTPWDSLIRSTTIVTHLHLNNNEISAEGGHSIRMALSDNKNPGVLVSLDLTGSSQQPPIANIVDYDDMSDISAICKENNDKLEQRRLDEFRRGTKIINPEEYAVPRIALAAEPVATLDNSQAVAPRNGPQPPPPTYNEFEDFAGAGPRAPQEAPIPRMPQMSQGPVPSPAQEYAGAGFKGPSDSYMMQFAGQQQGAMDPSKFNPSGMMPPYNAMPPGGPQQMHMGPDGSPMMMPPGGMPMGAQQSGWAPPNMMGGAMGQQMMMNPAMQQQQQQMMQQMGQHAYSGGHNPMMYPQMQNMMPPQQQQQGMNPSMMHHPQQQGMHPSGMGGAPMGYMQQPSDSGMQQQQQFGSDTKQAESLAARNADQLPNVNAKPFLPSPSAKPFVPPTDPSHFAMGGDQVLHNKMMGNAMQPQQGGMMDITQHQQMMMQQPSGVVGSAPMPPWQQYQQPPMQHGMPQQQGMYPQGMQFAGGMMPPQGGPIYPQNPMMGPQQGYQQPNMYMHQQQQQQHPGFMAGHPGQGNPQQKTQWMAMPW